MCHIRMHVLLLIGSIAGSVNLDHIVKMTYAIFPPCKFIILSSVI